MHAWTRRSGRLALLLAAAAGLMVSLVAAGNPGDPFAGAKPKPQPFYICGGKGDVLCQSNRTTNAPQGAFIQICYYSDTPCQAANHMWVVPKGIIGKDGYQPLRWPQDKTFFHGFEAVNIKWMKWSKNSRSFGPTVYCMVPMSAKSDVGIPVILWSCKNKTLGNPKRALWIIFPLSKVGGYPGAIGIANVYECNAHDKNSHDPAVMTSLFDLKKPPADRVVYMAPLYLGPHEQQGLFWQSWDFDKAPVK